MRYIQTKIIDYNHVSGSVQMPRHFSVSVCPQLSTGLTTGQRPPALGRVLNCILATSANPHSRHGRHVINITRCA